MPETYIAVGLDFEQSRAKDFRQSRLKERARRSVNQYLWNGIADIGVAPLPGRIAVAAHCYNADDYIFPRWTDPDWFFTNKEPTVEPSARYQQPGLKGLFESIFFTNILEFQDVAFGDGVVGNWIRRPPGGNPTGRVFAPPDVAYSTPYWPSRNGVAARDLQLLPQVQLGAGLIIHATSPFTAGYALPQGYLTFGGSSFSFLDPPFNLIFHNAVGSDYWDAGELVAEGDHPALGGLSGVIGGTDRVNHPDDPNTFKLGEGWGSINGYTNVLFTQDNHSALGRPKGFTPITLGPGSTMTPIVTCTAAKNGGEDGGEGGNYAAVIVGEYGLGRVAIITTHHLSPWDALIRWVAKLPGTYE